MLPSVDTKSPAAVGLMVRKTFLQLFPGAPLTLLARVFQETEFFFTGRHPDYQAIDLRYHDFEHTLQATVCLTCLLEGAQQSGAIAPLTARQFELAIAAALLHDSGYLKARSDVSGTGAKYTLTHVLRSCAFAATHLPTLGVKEDEIGGVLSAINCTGPDKLETLYGEFRESDNFVDMPLAKRRFKSPQDLVNKTPYFWSKIIRPRLETDFQAVYRFLARPYPHGTNAYLEDVEHNIAIVRQRTEAKAPSPG